MDRRLGYSSQIRIPRTRTLIQFGMIALLLLFVSNATAQPGRKPPPLVPPGGNPSVEVFQLFKAPFLKDDERKELHLFHGWWTRADLDTPERRANAALLEYRLNSDALSDPAAPPEDRASAMIKRGEMTEALQLLHDVNSVRGSRLRAEALEWLGRFADADEALNPAVLSFENHQLDSATDLTEMARCFIIRARLRGEPAGYYQRIVALLSQVEQRIDRFYWPAKLVESELLLEKDNYQEAINTLHEVLALNPRDSDAWYHLGEIALTGYDFDSAEQAITRLEHINPDHPLAHLLRAQSALLQHDADTAQTEVNSLLQKWPRNREALALRAAIAAARFDQPTMQQELKNFDKWSPNHPYAYYITGTQLATDRQYELSEDILNESVRRQPNWSLPRIELGLMEMQAGNDVAALRALRRVAELDPFNKRAAFSLHLLEDLMTYEIIESKHFTIRFDPKTSDRVLAVEMGPLLDNMYEEVTSVFQYEPKRRTVIELLPNHERFAVRITGMPELHTIAASTGPVIAMESPRNGPNHFGTYDWLRVVRHEFVHTVTLGQTHNRIPHWLTEAAAVWQELAPRTYENCKALTRAYKTNYLFKPDYINWAFVRPKRPGDRSLAYAQSEWTFEYFMERFGHRRMIELLDDYRKGLTEEQALQDVTGESRIDFYENFLTWAGEQIQQWGMNPEPSLDKLMDDFVHENKLSDGVVDSQAEANAGRMNDYIIKRMMIPRSVLDSAYENTFAGMNTNQQKTALNATTKFVGTQLHFPKLPPVRIPSSLLKVTAIDEWLNHYPAQPDILLLRLKKSEGDTSQAMIRLFDRYQSARPVDPMPFRRLADYFIKSGEPRKAVPYLEELDRREQSTGSFAVELAKIYRSEKNYRRALTKIHRALVIEPFNANYRELAATIALQMKDYQEARRQLLALTIIEPGRIQHQKRLEALDRLQQRSSGE